MRAVHIIGLTSILVASLLIAPLAFAENDNNEGKSEGKGKGNDNKPAFLLPFTSLGTTSAALQEQLKSLRELLENIKKQREALDDDNDDDDDDTSASSTKVARDALKMEIKETKRELKFLRSLRRGMSGDDVRDLQELLAQDPSIFPEGLITGFFGELTERAIKRFQAKFGIDAIGIFGPRTQAKILALFVGRELPPGIIKRLGLGSSTTTPGVGFVTICHKPVGVSPQTLVIGVPALGAHLSHGDTVSICPGGGTGTTTPPSDTTAPVLSALSASSTASTSAQVMWTTNETATSKLWYGLTSPLVLGGSTANFLNSMLITNHVLAIDGLSASTTYYYVAESADASGNTATSSEQSFSTPN